MIAQSGIKIIKFQFVNKLYRIHIISIQMMTSDLLKPLNENIFKRKFSDKSLESMIKTGLVPTGEKPSFSHSSQ